MSLSRELRAEMRMMQGLNPGQMPPVDKRVRKTFIGENGRRRRMPAALVENQQIWYACMPMREALMDQSVEPKQRVANAKKALTQVAPEFQAEAKMRLAEMLDGYLAAPARKTAEKALAAKPAKPASKAQTAAKPAKVKLKNIPQAVADKALASGKFTAEQLAIIDHEIYKSVTPDWSENTWTQICRLFTKALALSERLPADTAAPKLQTAAAKAKHAAMLAQIEAQLASLSEEQQLLVFACVKLLNEPGDIGMVAIQGLLKKYTPN